MDEKENTPDIFEEEIQPDNMETQVRKFRNSLASDGHISTESMALTTLSKDGDKKDNDKKKKKKKEKTKDKKVSSPLMGASNFDKPLRGNRSSNRQVDNHIDDGYLRHHNHTQSIRRRQEQDTDVCFTCLRNALHCYNIVVLIIGMGAVSVGVWLLVTDFSAREISVIINSNLFEIGTYLLLGGGGLIALLAFCGCCGTMREDRCILGFYGVVLTLVFFAFIAGGVLAFIFRDDISLDFKETFADTIQKNYVHENEARTNSYQRLVTDAWDSLQRKLECCGAYGNVSSQYSWAIYKLHTDWYTEFKEKWPYVPESCCKPGGNKEICVGEKYTFGPPARGPPFNGPGTRYPHKENPNLYTVGCYDKVADYMLQHSLILGAVAFAIPIFLIVGSVITFCVCAKVRKTDEDDDEEDAMSYR